MAMLTSTSPEMVHQYQTAYDQELLKQKEDMIVMEQFAFKKAFPSDAGAKTMRFSRFKNATSAAVSALTEGVPLNVYSELDIDYTEATLAGYGTQIKLTDILLLTNLFNSMRASQRFIAQAMALHSDDVIRNAVVTGVTTNKRYAQQLASFAALSAASNTAGALTITDLLDAMTVLTIQGAPKRNGQYFAIVPPQVARDLMNSAEFRNVAYYQDKGDMVKGEVGKWFGIRIVVTSNPFRETSGGTEGTFAAAGGIFTTIVTGTDGFGVPSLAGYSPFNPKTYLVNQPDRTDVLNQTAILGAKTYYATAVTNEAWVVTIRSKTGHA